MKTLIALGLLIGGVALAGPPMVCHPLHIGSEVSLPWSAKGDAWDGRDPQYVRSRLVADTLALLKADTPVLARMETLRRAAIYAETPARAVELADRLMARTKEAGAHELAAFDAGYFIEVTHQLPGSRKSDPLAGRDGYTLAKQSLTKAKDVAAVEYGLSLMIPGFPNEHFAKAKLGAKQGSLLAVNVRELEAR
jgi:hypothetical protein